MDQRDSELLVERKSDGIAVITLNRPKAMNALTVSLRSAIADAFRALHGDESVRVIVLTGGDKAFAAGADLREFVDTSATQQHKRHFERYYQAITDTPQPIIAAVNGFALGGGCELAMSADIIIAGEGAKFGQPEVKVGIIPGAGGTQRLTRAVGKYKAMLLALTGDFVSAAEADAMGLVSRVVPDDKVMDEALALAGRIAALPPLAVQSVKEMIVAGQDASLSAALTMERKTMQLLFASADKQEGMRAFLDKRKPSFKGE